MLFTNSLFFPFLLLTFLLWLPLRGDGRKAVLLGASLVFYGFFDVRFLALLLGVWLVVHLVPQLAARREGVARTRWTASGIVVLCAALVGFKYAGFFVGAVAAGTRALGFALPADVLRIAMPVGMSFYTFQAISYLVDVHRRRIPPSTRPLDTALYVAFFPLVLSGPIEKGARFMPQIAAHRPFTIANLRNAFERLLVGYLLKIGVADPLVPFCTDVFGRAAHAGSGELVLAAYAYALQVFADFAGYSLIARGVAALFGYEVINNFAQPYLSRSFSEFWRRWHISLSSWISEYVYAPLMSRVLARLDRLKLESADAEMRIAYPVVTMITMTLVGLWHGSGLNYLAWGAFHGACLSFERLFVFRKRAIRMRPKLGTPAAWIKAIAAVIVVFHLVTLGWILFRADSLGAAFSVVTRIATAGGWSVQRKMLGMIVAGYAVAGAISLVEYRREDEWSLRSVPGVLRGVAYAAAVLYCVVVGSSGGNVPFIYFQF